MPRSKETNYGDVTTISIGTNVKHMLEEEKKKRPNQTWNEFFCILLNKSNDITMPETFVSPDDDALNRLDTMLITEGKI